MKSIIVIPNLVLTTPAKNVTAFDKKLANLITDMKETLLVTKNPKGVGLAATQIGVGVRIFLTKPNDASKIRAFVNPEIVQKHKSLTDGIPERGNKLEGCLSIPNVWGKVRRATSVTLRYQDETGSAHEEKFSGFMATIIQHETDHLDGILYTQRVLEQKDKLFQVAKDDNGEEVLEEIRF